MAASYTEVKTAINIHEFDIKNLVFEDVVEKSRENLKIQRVPIKYVVNGKKEDLVIATPDLVTYGVQENRKDLSKSPAVPIESYSLPLIMSDEATNKVFEQILAKCKAHLNKPTTARALEKGSDQVEATTKLMDIYVRKRDKGVLVPGVNPTLYPKLYTKFVKVPDVNFPPPITTEFYDDQNVDIDPLTLLGVKARVQCALFIKEIYIGAIKPSIQIKVNDVLVREKLVAIRRMLPPPQPSQPAVSAMSYIEDDETPEDIVQPIAQIVQRRKVPKALV